MQTVMPQQNLKRSFRSDEINEIAMITKDLIFIEYKLVKWWVF